MLYYVYTFSTEVLITAGGTQTEIVAYSQVYKNDKWCTTVSYKGYAPTNSLRDLDAETSSDAIDYSSNVSMWLH